VIASRTAHVLRLAGLALIGSVVVCAVGAGSSSSAYPTSGPLIEFWDGTSWTQQLGPNPNGTGRFSAVSALSATDAWAIGAYSTGDVENALATHWDGSSWQLVAMPTPADKFDFSDMAAISATDVWAVGWHGRRQFKSEHPLIEHWNGSAWTIVPHPSPGENSLLNGVAAVSPRNVWAVGAYSAAPHRYNDRTLILHWNGTSWKRIPSPHPGTSAFPGSQLSGVAVVSAKSIWAVGSYSRRAQSSNSGWWTLTLVLHWNGKKWRQVRSTNPDADRGSNALYDVAAVGRNNVWAVGGSYTYQTPPLVEHWNGHPWHAVPAASGCPHSYWQPLTDLAPLARNDIWAAGTGVGPYPCDSGGLATSEALAEHWDGNAWSVSPIVNPPLSVDDAFLGIAAAAPHAVWAVGYY